MNKKKTDKLNSLISEKKSGWLDKAKWREENEAWLDISFSIAVKMLGVLRENEKSNVSPMNQKELAEAMNCSPQYINKVLKGTENLQLETILKIGSILDIQLIKVPKIEEFTQEVYSSAWAVEPIHSYGANRTKIEFPKAKKELLANSLYKTQKIEQRGIAYKSIMNKFTFEEDFDNDPNSPLKIVA